MLTKQHITIGSKNPVKNYLARELRKEMTPAEKLLWNELRANRLKGYHFRRQQVIDGFIADFYCHSTGLIVELDGGAHDNQQEYDELRDTIITSGELRIVRFRNEQVFDNLSEVLAEITRLLKGMKAVPESSPQPLE